MSTNITAFNVSQDSLLKRNLEDVHTSLNTAQSGRTQDANGKDHAFDAVEQDSKKAMEDLKGAASHIEDLVAMHTEVGSSITAQPE